MSWTQWLIEMLRDRDADRQKALSLMAERAEEKFRHALGDCDAFVKDAQAIDDGLLVGDARSSTGEEIPIRLPWGDEHVHWIVQGGTGSGKTTWISCLLRDELLAHRSFGVIDCKGDLFDAAVQLTAAMAQTFDHARKERLLKRLVVVNPFSDALVPLNICRPFPACSPEVQAYEVALVLARLFDTSFGLHMENILRHLLLLLIEANLTLVEAPLVLQDEVLRAVLASRTANPAIKEFFLGTYASIPQVSKDALQNRLQGLLLAENVRLMLGADELVDLRGTLERGDPLFVFLGKGPGVPEEQVEILGGLFLQLLFQSAYARGSGRHRGYLLAIDEFFHLLAAPAMAKRFETALTTARSFGLSLLLINHNFAQLPTALREIILGNCDLVALFRTSTRNAEFFGDFLPEIDPEAAERAWAEGQTDFKTGKRDRLEMLQRLPDRHCYWYDRRKPYRALRLHVPHVPRPYEILGTSAGKLRSLIEEEGWRRGGTAVPRSILTSQIQERRKKLQELIRPPIHVSSKEIDQGKRSDSLKKGKPRLG